METTKIVNYDYFLSLISWYEFGASIKKTIHQIRIKNPKIEVIKVFLKISQLKIRTKIPKLIIDQGWHQKGFDSQKLFFEFVSIKEPFEINNAFK